MAVGTNSFSGKPAHKKVCGTAHKKTQGNCPGFLVLPDA
ncbi:hypothetical protein RK21_04530 [Pseudomonas plecoglossicida]|nr:hypothetical protein RK21_04530 [Pseudomonas plecoglossicida]